MAIAEELIPTSILEDLKGAAVEGASLVNISVEDSPLRIVTAIDSYIKNQPKGKSRVDNWENRALPVGSLWGEQLVREFGWEWRTTYLEGNQPSKAIGVFEKDRSLGVYPWHFIFGCLEYGEEVKVLLAYNFLKSGKIPELKPRGYLNLMEHIQYIVPPW